MPDKICFIEKTSLDRLALNGGLIIALGNAVAAIMPHAQERSKREGRHESTIAAHVFRKAEW
jgi:hypothetical protein